MKTNSSNIQFKISQERMTYYSQQALAITYDEQDNTTLRQFSQKYKHLFKKCQDHQKESQQLKLKINQLKQQNKRLIQQINQLSKDHKYQKQQVNDRRYVPKMTFGDGYSTLPPETTFLTHTYQNRSLSQDRTAYLHQTKHRVIDGFVSQLALELDQAQDVLRRERRMQQQTRRTLALCNQELNDLRVAYKRIDNQLAASICQNKVLRQDIEREREEKELLSRQLQRILKSQQNKQANINFQQLDIQLNRMDEVYRSIEMQLNSRTDKLN